MKEGVDKGEIGYITMYNIQRMYEMYFELATPTKSAGPEKVVLTCGKSLSCAKLCSMALRLSLH